MLTSPETSLDDTATETKLGPSEGLMGLLERDRRGDIRTEGLV